MLSARISPCEAHASVDPVDQCVRLTAALDLLKKLGGAVALHETHGKTLIRGKSCPLAAITAHYPDACLIVEALLTEIIGVPVKEHCAHGQSPSCCFEVS